MFTICRKHINQQRIMTKFWHKLKKEWNCLKFIQLQECSSTLDNYFNHIVQCQTLKCVMQRDKQYGKSLKDLVRNLKEKYSTKLVQGRDEGKKKNSFQIRFQHPLFIIPCIFSQLTLWHTVGQSNQECKETSESNESCRKS